MLAAYIRQVQTGFDGWKNLLFKKDSVEQLAASRKTICDDCTHREPLTCGMCGCPLAAKQRAVEATCPDGQW